VQVSCALSFKRLSTLLPAVNVYSRYYGVVKNGCVTVVKSTSSSQPELPEQFESRSSVISKDPRTSFNLLKDKWRICLGVGLGGGAIALGILWYRLETSIPDSIANVASYARPDTLTIKAADGTVLKEVGAVTHEKIALETLPDIVEQAFIASEDRRFYRHHGVDLRGIARAFVVNLKAGDAVEGGSTITQQLARMAFLDREKKIWRKLKEVRIASEIEHNLTKPKILETYLNLVYLGAGSYGVADAAWVYFGKSPQELTLAEAATLAGIVPAPSVYSPLRDRELAIQRRNLVIDRLAQQKFISPETAKTAKNSELVLNPKQPRRLQRQASYFTNYIETELPKYVSPEVLAAGGVVVETTLDTQWQKAAELTVSYGLDNYGKWQKFQQAALVAIDPRTGGIKAMVGGRDFGDNQYNRVTQAQRQPGSTFKTFVYTAAIASGVSPYQSYFDGEYSVDGYKPRNHQDRYRYTEVSLYDALAASINIVALRTMMDVGWNPTIELAHKMGIKSELKPTYSLALGAWEVNLLELTNAYATLADRGQHRENYGIARILDAQGQVIYRANFQPTQAIDRATADMMNWMLQSVVERGTGIPAQIGRSVAGKTGTSDESRDLWFIGYIPQVTAGVWLGNDDNKPTNGTSGVAAEMWRKFMLQIVSDLPVENFPERPPLTGRTATIKAEAIKPKSTYYRRKATSTYPSSVYRQPTQSSPATPTPHLPKTGKLNKIYIAPNHPINDPNRDWVKERLGRE
jgi:penicillin-binding protein 1A